MDFLSFLEITNATGEINCNDETLLGVLSIAKTVVRILQIVVPIALIVWGTLDLGKAVIEGDEKKMKEKRKPFIQRIISAVIVFLVPWFVLIIMQLVKGGAYYQCWENANKGIGGIGAPNDPVNGG